jgi:dynactin complex subunit
METILVYPNKPEEVRSIKAFLKALKINFETSPYNPEFVAKIEASAQEAKEGKVTTVRNKEELHSFLDSL